jgi:hypothetical protein
MKKLAILLPIAMLSACNNPPEANIPASQVVRVATAPDGTVLWGVRTGGRNVYFASTGTQTTQSCGKNCVRPVQVPTAVRPQ